MPASDPSFGSTAPATANEPASTLGDFVVAWGPETDAWLRSLPGFTLVDAPAGDSVRAAVRGAVTRGTAPDGARWVAISDLIEGDLGDGARARTAGPVPHRDWRGRFAQVAWHPADGRAAAVTDLFSTVSLYTLVRGPVVLCATDLRLLAASPWCRRSVDLESVYHFLNFAQIPAPRTIFQDIRRLEPAACLRWTRGEPTPSAERYFLPDYPEDLRGTDSELARDLRDRIVDTIHAYRPAAAHGDGWGCFLSGGTDSSSIVSILARQTGRGSVKSFSIGFAEAGFDELGFAETAAYAVGAEASFARVSREQAQALVDRVIEAYDQPFGNASAIPTMACTDLAREKGVRTLLAGDGGDEIFGGNERYAKDQVMEAWFMMPAPLRDAARTLGHRVGNSSVHLLNRVENFFERASIPNPDRFYTDDSFASDHYEELLQPQFRAAVARDASLDFMRGVYAQGKPAAPLHRIMRLDLLMAIAQNDVRKVICAAVSAGVHVRFPYLDRRLLEYTGRLPARYKVRLLKKRFLFKQAMNEILPEKILKKKKQGFGLPIAVWLRSDAAFRDGIRETLFDARTTARGWWNPAFVERLLSEHVDGAWDHADYIWRLFVLERWLRRHADAVA
jgi:asparagine synthase (glutamine-hydrolysing)